MKNYSSSHLFRHLSSYLYVLLFIVLSIFESYPQNIEKNMWHDITEKNIQLKGERLINPKEYRTIEMDINYLNEFLLPVPKEGSTSVNSFPFIIELPLPGGNIEKFSIMEAPIMEPELAAKYPEIKTYRGQGVDNKSSVIRLDVTPAGFHSMVISASGTYFINPYNLNTDRYYISYWKKDLLPDASKDFFCENSDTDFRETGMTAKLSANGTLSGGELRTYRLAVAATGEYTAFHGGTAALSLASIVTAINRVNLIYEKELSVKMVLVANNNLIIYTNSATDPYTNNNGTTMLGQNQTNINTVIGAANYDIGHVFSTGGGGTAGTGVVCNSSQKAKGVSGLSAPIGDAFYIDYIAHEMGHQFGAHHSFNGDAGSCSGISRNESTAYEPGSGSTIMSYAGRCGSQNIQSSNSTYFHGISIDEIVAYTTTGGGSSCPVVTSTGNSAPVVDPITGGFTIPMGTPFSLSGIASDADNDILTYCWEEFDLGNAGDPNSPVGNDPIFRSFSPTTLSTRTFPALTYILNNNNVSIAAGELLPGYTRTMTFRLTARDNKSGGGGVGKADISFNIEGNAGPFKVTSPNTNVSWMGNTVHTINWDVANTDAVPVSVSSVNILLSTNGGYTFPITLASGTANDGSEDVLIPNNPGDSARIKVEAVGNIFFDISNTNFQITENIFPVELTSFNASNLNGQISLSWSTATETNNYGFEVQRLKDYKIERLQNWEPIGFVKGNGNSNSVKEYFFSDENVNEGNYQYRLKQIDNDGKFEYSKTVEVVLTQPFKFELLQNYPNPFNPSTTISYSLPSESHVTLKIFDILGNEIATLINEQQNEGKFEVEFNTSGLSSGTYFYTLETNETIQTRKMMVLR